MCGFAGWAGNDRTAAGGARILRTMGSYLAARGPDDETSLERAEFRVVFRRLAINDVQGGRQPFIGADGLVAVVNGEIYNHRELIRRYLADVAFSTRSDCEVVLHLYRKLGADFLGTLNGIYSIAIWDEAKRTLLLARDRLGVKPLYYSIAGETLVFASELKALLVHPAVPRSVDWDAFAHVPNASWPFARPAGRPVATGIKGVEFVEPATYVEWTDGRLRAGVKYWDPAGPGAARDGVDRAEDYVDRYADLIEDSVRMQLMSDVPVGLFLSGGLDSSLIAGIASRCTSGLEAFTLVEPSIARTGDTEAAVELTRRLGIPLHKVRVDREALQATVRLDLRTLEYFVWQMDFPLFDVEFLFKHELHRHAKAVAPDMKVILLGQGADEFAGGYSRIASPNWQSYTESETRSLHISLLGRMGIPTGYRRYVDSAVAERSADAPNRRHEAWQYLRFGDLAAYNLWHEDRMASANGMEARVPFLDHRLVEMLCAIPQRRREELFFDKAIERRAALRFLPAEFTRRPKVPLFRIGPGADDSIVALRRSILDGAFGEFREKYLATPNALFSTREIESLREQAAVPRIGDAALYLLLRCMAIAVFERMCREVARPGFEPPRLDARSLPLTTESIPVQNGFVLTAASRIALAQSVRLAFSCDAEPALLVIQDGILSAQIAVPGGPDRSGSAQTAFAGRQIDVVDLARLFDVEIEAVAPLAETFVARGWGSVSDGAEPALRAES